MTKNNNVPKVRFKGFTDAWEQREFGEVGSVSMCKRIFKDETVDDGEIPFYKIGTFGSEPDAYISRELYEEYRSKYSYPHKGDILLSASGTIGRIVEYNVEEAYFQDSNIVWLSHDETISNLFLKTLYPIVKWNGIEGSTIKRLYNDNFLKTQFMMPSLAEQTQIGTFFSTLDNLITLHQRKCETLQKLKKSMLQKMFPKNGSLYPEIRFAGFTDAWEQRKLITIADVLDGDRGKNYPTESDFTASGHTLFLNASNVTKDGFSFVDNQYISEEKSDSMGNGKLQEDDIVVTSRGSLGHIAWYNDDIMRFIRHARINSGMLILRKKMTLDSSYLYQFMKSHKGQEQISFISFGSAQPQLTKAGVEKLNIDLPNDLEEQTQIGSFFSQLDTLITLHQRKLEKLKNIKKAMLEKMFV